jgi:hypothetical protein
MYDDFVEDTMKIDVVPVAPILAGCNEIKLHPGMGKPLRRSKSMGSSLFYPELVHLGTMPGSLHQFATLFIR